MQDPQGHALGRPRVGPFPKRSQIRCFYGFPRFRRAHRACPCGCRGGRGASMGGGDGGTNGCAVGGGLSSVSAPQTPIFWSILQGRLYGSVLTIRPHVRGTKRDYRCVIDTLYKPEYIRLYVPVYIGYISPISGRFQHADVRSI